MKSSGIGGLIHHAVRTVWTFMSTSYAIQEGVLGPTEGTQLLLGHRGRLRAGARPEPPAALFFYQSSPCCSQDPSQNKDPRSSYPIFPGEALVRARGISGQGRKVLSKHAVGPVRLAGCHPGQVGL